MTGRHSWRSARARVRDRIPHWLAIVYRPEPLPAWAGPTITCLLVVTAGTRAADYLSYPTPDSEILAYVEVIGVRAWGWAFAVVAAALLAALLSRGLAPLVLAHVVGLGVYLGYTVALLQGALEVTDDAPGRWRFVAISAAGLGLHIVRVLTLAHEVYEHATAPPPDRRAHPR